MTTSKQFNGFGTGISEAHLRALQQKKKSTDVLQLDRDIEQVIMLTETLHEKGLLGIAHRTKLILDFMVVGLGYVTGADHHVHAGSKGEKVTSLESLRQRFMNTLAGCSRMDDATKVIGKRFEKPDGFEFTKPAKAATKCSEAENSPATAKLESATPSEKSPTDVLLEKGYIHGAFVTESKAKSNTMFAITEVGETCTLQEHIQLQSNAEPRICKVEWMSLLSYWKLDAKGPLKMFMLKDHIQKYPTEMPSRFVHLERMSIYDELLKMSEAHGKVNIMKDAIFVQPETLRWGCDVKKGELLLTPAVPLENIKWYKVGDDKHKPCHPVYELGELKVTKDFGTVMFYIEPLKFPSVSKPDSNKAVNPCFNVGKTSDLTKVNMEIILLEFGGYVFKCFQNVTDVKQYDALCMYAEIDEYKAFSSCTSVETIGDVKRRRLLQKTEC
jgi:hypothetical protein